MASASLPPLTELRLLEANPIADISEKQKKSPKSTELTAT